MTKQEAQYLLKQAISFGATRTLLRNLKANPGTIVNGYSYIKPIGKKYSIIHRPNNDAGYLYNSFNRHKIVVGKKVTSPRSTLFHEYGHLLDDTAGDQKNIPLSRSDKQQLWLNHRIAPEDITKLKLEREANINAVEFMRKNNVSPELQQKYQQDMLDSGYNTYRQNFAVNYKPTVISQISSNPDLQSRVASYLKTMRYPARAALTLAKRYDPYRRERTNELYRVLPQGFLNPPELQANKINRIPYPQSSNLMQRLRDFKQQKLQGTYSI